MSMKNISIAGTATVGPKGQVVIPAEVREKMGINPGDKLIALTVEGREMVGFVTEAHIQAMVNQMDAHLNELKVSLGDHQV